MSDVEDTQNTWPPAPNAAPPVGTTPSPNRAARTPYLTVILVMWGVTIAQFILQAVGLGSVGKLFGFIGFVLAVYLVSRRDRAATINGGWRLVVAALGLLVHLLDSR